MSVSLPLLEDACTRLAHTTKSMFGGHGLFAPNGGMFAGVVDEDRIIFKLADDAARSELEALGGKAWTYAGKMTMREWIVVPEAFYDDQELMMTWARRAHALAPAKVVKPKKAAKAKAAAEKPAAKKPAAEKPAAKKPAAKKPAAKRPAAKKPAAKKPATPRRAR